MATTTTRLIIVFAILLEIQSAEALITNHWRYWTSSSGLTESFCSNIAVSPNGVVWANHGQVEFVSRLDGYSIEQYPIAPNNPFVVESKSGDIWSILYDQNNQFGGFLRYENHQWIKHEFPPEQGHPTFGFSKFIPYPDQKILMVFPNQLVLYDLQSMQATVLKTVKETQLESFIYLYYIDDTRMWVSAERGAALVTIDPQSISTTFQWTEYPFPAGKNYQTLIACWENQNRQLVGNVKKADNSNSILLRLNQDRWEQIQEETEEAFMFLPAGGDNLWKLTSQPAGYLLTYKSSTYQIEMDYNRVLSGSITNADKMIDGSLFLSTPFGIAKYTPPIWNIPPEIPYPEIYCNGILEDNHQRVWFACRDRLLCYHRDEWKDYRMPGGLIDLYETNQLHTLADGRLVINTDDQLLWMFDPASESFERIEHPKGKRIQLIAPKRNGDGIWVNTQDNFQEQIEYFDGKQFVEVVTNFKDHAITSLRSMYEDSQGRLWLGGVSAFKLGVIENGEFRTYQDKYPGDSALSIFQPDLDRLWFADRDGIFEYDGSEWKPIKSGLDQVPTMIKGQQDIIWIASWNGIHRFDGHSWISNNEVEGLPDAAAMAVFQDSQGRIWVGTTRGISLYYPDADINPPIARLGQTVSEIGPEGNAQFVYSGTDKWNTTHPDRLLFSYRMDQQAWSPYQSDTVATFQGLSPGNHRFSVRAMDRNGNESQPVFCSIQVRYFWYQEPGFIVSMVFSSAAILFFVVLAISRHRKAQHYVRQLQETNRQLYEANERLQELDEMKTAFVSQASHDLRTPLTGIKGSLDNLRLGIAGELNDKQQRLIDRALRSVERLSLLVGDLLDLSRIESGRTVLEKSNIPLRLLVDNVMQEHRASAAQKNIRLVHGKVLDTIMIHADGGKLQRIIGELIHNAIKYTPENGTVEVSLEKQNDAVVLSVKDTGIGISKEESHKIWERFYRTPSAQNIAKGSGLGLSIVKELVAMHDGTITMESQPNQGTTFTIRLPIKR